MMFASDEEECISVSLSNKLNQTTQTTGCVRGLSLRITYVLTIVI